MKEKNAKQSWLVYTLLILLIISAGIALYFYLLKPEMDKRNSLQEKYDFQKSHLEGQAKKVESTKKLIEKAGPVGDLKLKIPTNNHLTGITDDLAELEGSTSTVITDIQFNNYGSKKQVQTPKLKSTGLSEAELINPLSDTQVVSRLADQQKPKGLNLLTFEMSVSAYEASNITDFVKGITEMPRLYVVDSVKYSDRNVENGVVTAKVQVTTFNVKLKKEAKKGKALTPKATEESNKEK